MGILLVLVPWGYGKWRVQFYKYTIEYIIEIKKTKTDVQEDNIGLKGGVPPPPDLDRVYFTDKYLHCSIGLKLIQTLFFVFAPKFYLLHLENITSFKFSWGNSKNHILLDMSPHKAYGCLFSTCVLNCIKYNTPISIGSYTSLFITKFKPFFSFLYV